MKGLLLLGLPRSCTTLAYDFAARATGLKRPPVDAGEVLNPQRWANAGADCELPKIPFNSKPPILEYRSPGVCAAYYRQLDQYRNGYIIKDVVQPYLIVEYIRQNPDAFNILHVHRSLDRVLFHLEKKNWSYVRNPHEVQIGFQDFLTLDVQRALFEEDYFFDVLELLGYEVKRFSYLNRQFCRTRDYKAAQYYFERVSSVHSHHPAKATLVRDLKNPRFYVHLSLFYALDGQLEEARYSLEKITGVELEMQDIRAIVAMHLSRQKQSNASSTVSSMDTRLHSWCQLLQNVICLEDNDTSRSTLRRRGVPKKPNVVMQFIERVKRRA